MLGVILNSQRSLSTLICATKELMCIGHRTFFFFFLQRILGHVLGHVLSSCAGRARALIFILHQLRVRPVTSSALL